MLWILCENLKGVGVNGYIRVVGYELELREQVTRAGGIWRPKQQLWELPYGQILALGLEDRIVDNRS